MSPNMGIIGIGHPMRGDDALGQLAVDRLKALAFDGLEMHTCLGDMTELFEVFEKFDTILLIDAIMTGQKPPGTCYRLMKEDFETMAAQCRVSTHAFDLGQTLELAENLGLLPNQLIIYGIESSNFDEGTQPSAPVLESIPKLIETIQTDISNLMKD